MKNLYSKTDEFIEKLKRKIRVEFNHMSVTSLDELNVITTKKKTQDMYNRLLKFNKLEYLKISQKAREFTEDKLTEEERSKVKGLSTVEIVAVILASYNPITGYLYESEAERKMMRLIEEILTSKEYLDEDMRQESLRKAANLWFTQSAQYGIDIADGTAIEIFKKAGLKNVIWVTEKDTRVCKVCRERDGMVYPIEHIPPKSHYNCRCHLEPYRIGEQTEQ